MRLTHAHLVVSVLLFDKRGRGAPPTRHARPAQGFTIDRHCSLEGHTLTRAHTNDFPVWNTQ